MTQPAMTDKPVTCKDCVHAEFERTPTGRIKRGHVGKCLKQGELIQLAKECAAPCVVLKAYGFSIWPDTPASNCSERKTTT